MVNHPRLLLLLLLQQHAIIKSRVSYYNVINNYIILHKKNGLITNFVLCETFSFSLLRVGSETGNFVPTFCTGSPPGFLLLLLFTSSYFFIYKNTYFIHCYSLVGLFNIHIGKMYHINNISLCCVGLRVCFYFISDDICFL